jgi:hypothetical protein
MDLLSVSALEDLRRRSEMRMDYNTTELERTVNPKFGARHKKP